MKRILAGIWCLLLAACSDQYPPTDHRPSETSRVHVVSIQGTNTGIIEGATGLWIIDPGFEDSHQQAFTKARSSLSDKPIHYVVNTHSHFDHTAGNRFLAEQGATIIIQDNARYSDAYLNETFTDSYRIEEDGIILDAHHIMSHSYDDALLHLPEDNIIFMGDSFTNSGHPTFYAGGIDGQRAILEKAISLANDTTRIIPGHGTETSVAALISYRDDTDALYQRVAFLHAEGMSPDEILSDSIYQELMLAFNTTDAPDFLDSTAVRRFAGRVVHSDLVATIALSEERIGELTGVYSTEAEERYEVVLQQERLFLRQTGNFLAELMPLSDRRFHVRASLSSTATFDNNPDDPEVLVMTLQLGDEVVTAQRISD